MGVAATLPELSEWTLTKGLKVKYINSILKDVIKMNRNLQ